MSAAERLRAVLDRHSQRTRCEPIEYAHADICACDRCMHDALRNVVWAIAEVLLEREES